MSDLKSEPMPDPNTDLETADFELADIEQSELENLSDQDLALEAEAEDLEDNAADLAGVPAKGKRGMIGKAVAGAVQLWMRSKLQHHDHLDLQIQASNRQLLTGHIPQVDVVGQGLVYKGVHVRQIQIQGSKIKMNLGQVIRGKSFQLKQPLMVAANLELHQTDLAASATSPLLVGALQDLVGLLVKSTPSFAELLTELLQGEDTASSPDLSNIKIQDPQIRLGEQRVSLGLPLVMVTGKCLPLFLRFGLGLDSPQHLKFCQVEWLTSLEANRGMAIPELDGITANLGQDVALTSLDLQPERLMVSGEFTVRP
jgi:LmeA-like phospholipid-binding